MTDLERTLWGRISGDREFKCYCQGYWSEPMSGLNAHKRNDSYRDECYQGLWYGSENYLYEDNRLDVTAILEIASTTTCSCSPGTPRHRAYSPRNSGAKAIRDAHPCSFRYGWVDQVA